MTEQVIKITCKNCHVPNQNDTMETAALIWAEPFDRGDLKLGPGDIKEAVNRFKEQTGHNLGLIMLCPKNERFAEEIPEGIEVDYRGGILKGEVWMSPEKSWGEVSLTSKSGGFFEKQGVMDGSTIFATVNEKNFEVAKIKSQPLKTTMQKKTETRGRKPLKLPERQILAMSSAGMGSKQIAARLKDKYSIKVSFRTVASVISCKRQGLLFKEDIKNECIR